MFEQLTDRLGAGISYSEEGPKVLTRPEALDILLGEVSVELGKVPTPAFVVLTFLANRYTYKGIRIS